ncbi:DUF5666 domain-containing protein [Thiomicrorhabdus arctica]|uniref:DUF5666 domain-containing protein n=1 Tax=Thiomicrorhabdus arctica TaxID=131540 RepID=UPI000377BF00|nr:DUF5666 domain-containing protein [Thiomicrorhabdus arctica]
MIKSIKTTALTAAMALGLTACGGSGSGNTAGIGGSGYISSGTITGFGSVFVNGVEFETVSSAFDIEGTPGTQSNLAIGMVVRVNGTINPDGITGTATSIIFDDELQGPVSGLTPTPILPTTTSATFTVLGTTVKIDRSSTSFDGTTFNFDTIANNDNIEISGFFNASGTLLASRVELKEPFLADSSIVEIKGNLLTTDNINYTINGLIISISGATNIDDLPNGLSNGIPVQVQGTLNGAHTIITAKKFESEELKLNDSEEFEMEGFITNYVDNTNFTINGITVDASAANLSPSGITLANDLQVEAEGSIVNGVLKAQKLKLRGGDVKVYATVSAIDINAKTFKVSPILAQPAITIGLGTETEMKNELTGKESLNITHLTDGDFVQIEGFENNGSVFASQVKIVNPGKIKVQGNITETNDDGFITVLGMKFDIASSTFEDSNNNSIPTETLFNVAAGTNPLISVTAASDVGTAEKVELE